ncbi:MAG TPA: hypothetical protein VJ987_13305, partial [Anaerolineales bacterium]|nr:hypothetical protein [Anaerolineales bacterium]
NGQITPDWFEGQVLPPFSDTEANPDRSLFAVEAKFSPKNKPLNPVSTMIVKGNYKLIYLAGYDELGQDSSSLELYDLEKDPEELQNLADSKPSILVELRNELLTEMQKADKPYLAN